MISKLAGIKSPSNQPLFGADKPQPTPKKLQTYMVILKEDPAFDVRGADRFTIIEANTTQVNKFKQKLEALLAKKKWTDRVESMNVIGSLRTLVIRCQECVYKFLQKQPEVGGIIQNQPIIVGRPPEKKDLGKDDPTIEN
jgi:hypothetical protein